MILCVHKIVENQVFLEQGDCCNRQIRTLGNRNKNSVKKGTVG